MVERRITKGCCGRKSIVMTTLRPVRTHHVALFQQAGFVCPDNYIKSGLLYAKKENFIGTCTFGICNINVRCNGANCDAIINEFETVLRTIENEPGGNKPRRL
jgi:hypothetical protein